MLIGYARVSTGDQNLDLQKTRWFAQNVSRFSKTQRAGKMPDAQG